MSDFVQVVVNPGAGGAGIDTVPVSDGSSMPVSALAVSPDGVADPRPVTGLRPLPVVDQAANNTRDDLRVNMQAIVDLLTTSVLSVAATITGQAQAGQSPPDGRAVVVQGIAGGVPQNVAVAGVVPVQLSPSNAVAAAVDESGNPQSLPVQRGARVVPVINQEISGQLDHMVAKLDAILLVLMQMSGVSLPANHPAFNLTY